MEGVPRCGGAEQLFDGSCGKRPVARESQRRGIDARSQSRPPEQWVLRSADFLGQDDVGGSIPGEIIRINAEPAVRRRRVRSEEHTSELQSQFHLVCRLLLEKKK